MSVIAHSPNGSAIFCDDVRQEMNGKQILIGIYTTEMIIHPSFPAALPTFAVVVRYTERRSENYLPVTFKIFVPGQDDAAFEAEVSKEQLEAVPYSEDKEPDPQVLIGFAAQFRNFVIPEPGYIKVRAYRGDDEIKIGSMRIRLSDHPLDPTGVASPPL
jgi:hypothetical protein